MTIIGIDIGGANLKAATADGQAISHPFPLWQRPEDLAAELSSVVQTVTHRGLASTKIAVTMTGELADCYPSKKAGVKAIIEATTTAFPENPVAIYLVDGRFVSPKNAIKSWQLAAASNWHATASFLARRFPDQRGILIDLGSTTCDLIPFTNGKVRSTGNTDLSRLAADELVYTGVSRSPLAMVLATFRFANKRIGLAQERFATMDDVYLYLGEIEEERENCDTADGRPRTRKNAAHRLARMMCADVIEIDSDDLINLSIDAKQAQLATIDLALNRLFDRHQLHDQIWLSGAGEFLLRQLPSLKDHRRGSHEQRHVMSLKEELDESITQSAPAYAVARLLAWNEEQNVSLPPNDSMVNSQ